MKILYFSGLTIILLVGVFLLGRAGNKTTIVPGRAPTIDANGKQIIAITAKGGYYPQVVNAQANTPTVLKVTTNATFDCSAALVIPSIGYRKSLPPSGDTLIDIPAQAAGTKLQGLCAMGMYNFAIQFN